MTDAAKTELLVALAEEVMEFDVHLEGGAVRCITKTGVLYLWNPLVNAAQALGLLEKWCEKSKDRGLQISFCQTVRQQSRWAVDCENYEEAVTEFGGSFPEAATLAVARAVGIEVTP